MLKSKKLRRTIPQNQQVVNKNIYLNKIVNNIKNKYNDRKIYNTEQIVALI